MTIRALRFFGGEARFDREPDDLGAPDAPLYRCRTMTTDQHDSTLRAVVDAHSAFYENLRHQNPATSSWIAAIWSPWRARWDMITADGDPLTPRLIHQVATSLSELRNNARAHGVPVPVLSPYAHPSAQLAHIGYPHPPVQPTPDPMPIAPVLGMPDQINAETDRRFRDEMGWGPERKIDIRREASLTRRWLELRYQVAQEFAAANA